MNKRYGQPQVHTGSKETGMTLIVVLVILTAMTFLGLSAMSDSNMQMAMVRNSQLENMAYSAAMTETNSQINLINAPGSGLNDVAVVAVINSATGQIDTDDASLDFIASTVFDTDYYSALTQALTLSEPSEIGKGVGASGGDHVSGEFSLGANAFKWRYLEFNSAVSIDGTASSSDQTQGFKYFSAN